MATLLPPPAVGQETLLRGRVLVGGEPADTGTVVLHRVSPDTSGPVDSVRVGPGGTFALPLDGVRGDASPSVVWFASSRREGILYFGAPVQGARPEDDDYLIETYPTREARPSDPDLSVQRRNLFLEPVGDRWRVTDLVEVSNRGGRTLVAPEGGATFEYPLPEDATDLEVGEGDVAPAAVSLVGGDLRITAPLPPGERLHVVRYSIPGLPLGIPLPDTTAVVELLVGEPAPPLEVEGLRAMEPVELGPGTTYRRYAGSDVPPGTLTVREGSAPERLPVRAWGVGLALLLALAGLVAWYLPSRRRGRPAPAWEGGRREAVLVELAEMDEAHEAAGSPTPAEEEAYRKRREELMSRLRTLAGRG